MESLLLFGILIDEFLKLCIGAGIYQKGEEKYEKEH